jgi:hypothetical protein
MLEQVPLANPTGQGNTTWEALHAERALGVIDPESMKYVAMDDTNGHLMVAGAVSGTLSTLKVSYHRLQHTHTRKCHTTVPTSLSRLLSRTFYGIVST